MKKILITIALLALAAVSFAQNAGDKISFSATDMNGKSVSSEMFAKNKVTMLNIWGLPGKAQQHRSAALCRFLYGKRLGSGKGEADPGLESSAPIMGAA